MIRLFTLLVVIAGAGFVVTNAPPQKASDDVQPDLEALKAQRVQLLQDRVAAIKKWVEQGRAGISELVRPEMDVINAQLDYATSDDERKDLLAKLLTKYDLLIKLVELQASEPVRPRTGGGSNQQMLAESELLYLKSERIRIQILHDQLD